MRPTRQYVIPAIPSPAPTAADGGLLPTRDLATAWLLVVLIAVPAWVLTIGQARDMGVEPGTMGTALPLFLLLWVTMMAAMMLPSMAPVAITWVRGIGRQSSGWTRAARTAEFVGGYPMVWTAFGALAYAALALTGDLVADHPTAGRWTGFTAFLLAGLYQLGPLKNVCLISMEKLWSRGPLLSRVVGIAFLALAALAPIPGLAADGSAGLDAADGRRVTTWT